MGQKVGTLVILFLNEPPALGFWFPFLTYKNRKEGAVSMKYCAKNLQFYRKLFQQVLRFFEN